MAMAATAGMANAVITGQGESKISQFSRERRPHKPPHGKQSAIEDPRFSVPVMAPRWTPRRRSLPMCGAIACCALLVAEAKALSAPASGAELIRAPRPPPDAPAASRRRGVTTHDRAPALAMAAALCAVEEDLSPD